MSVEQELAQFTEVPATGTFVKQNGKLLKVSVSGQEIQARVGSMVGYQGDLRFEHAGSGGFGKMLKKMATGEGTTLMKISGQGEAFLADQAQDVHILSLANEQITVNGPNLLAFDAGISWDIQRVQGMSGMMSGGLFNVSLQGTGEVAVLSDGPPMLIQLDGTPTFADPSAAITWSGGVQTSMKTDVGFKSLTGRASGEEVQMAFGGQGWVLIQPSEGRVVNSTGSTSGGGGGGGDAASALGGLFGR